MKEFFINILITPIFHFPLLFAFLMSYANINTNEDGILIIILFIGLQLFLHSIPSFIRYKIFKIPKRSLLYSLITAICIPISIFIIWIVLIPVFFNI